MGEKRAPWHGQFQAVSAVHRHLTAGGPYRYRYPRGTDGLPGKEGAFLPCSFWLVQAPAGLGRVDQATRLMRDLMEVALLGLLSEGGDPATGELLGNHPEALTHAALLQAALALHAAGAVTRDPGTATLAVAAGPATPVAGERGNPVEIRNCPAAVNGNDRRHEALGSGLGSDGQ